MKSHFLSVVLLLLPFAGAWAQGHEVQGRVSDTSGEALAGAMVLVQGPGGSPKSTAMADIDGLYKISCDPQDVLEFRYLGLKDHAVKVNGRSRWSCRPVFSQRGAAPAAESSIVGVVKSTKFTYHSRLFYCHIVK